MMLAKNELPLFESTAAATDVFIPNRHGTDLSVRCMRPYEEYRQFTPNSNGGAHSNAALFENRQQKNSKFRELCTWKQSPLNSDHVLILNASLSRKHSAVCEMGLCARVSYHSHSAQIQIFHNICDVTNLNAKLLFIM